jgi:hypothetical protein
MTKREVLLQVCENPGWEPPDVNGIERHLDELRSEGWILPRLDGWAATPRAMDAFPDFTQQADIADPTEREHAEHRCVAADRVVTLVVGMLRELPIATVLAIAAASNPATGPEWEIAVEIVERMTNASPRA